MHRTEAGQVPDKSRTTTGQTTPLRGPPEPKPPGLGMVSISKLRSRRRAKTFASSKCHFKAPHRAHWLHNSPSILRTTISLNEPPRLGGETLGTNALAKRNNPMGGDCGQERIEPSAVDDHIMTGEGHSHLFAVTLRVNKLMPGKHHGLLLKHDLQRCDRIAGADDPGALPAETTFTSALLSLAEP